MQIEHSSKYNLFSANGMSKCSLPATGSTSTSSNRNSLTSDNRSKIFGQLSEDCTSIAPKVQYLTPTCILLTYDDTDIGSLLDEHFRKSLNSTGKAPSRHRNLPPSFWNRHYSRTQRSSSTALANAAVAAAAASMAANPGGTATGASFGYYPDAYSSLLRSHHQTAASFCWPSYGAAHHGAFTAAVSGQQPTANTSDGACTSGQAAVAAYGLSEASILNGHMNDAVHAYNPFLNLTRPTPNPSFVAHSRIPAPPQYSNMRNDWTNALPNAMDSMARDFTTTHGAYQFSGLNPQASQHHLPMLDSYQNKDNLRFSSTQMTQ